MHFKRCCYEKIKSPPMAQRMRGSGNNEPVSIKHGGNFSEAKGSHAREAETSLTDVNVALKTGPPRGFISRMKCHDGGW